MGFSHFLLTYAFEISFDDTVLEYIIPSSAGLRDMVVSWGFQECLKSNIHCYSDSFYCNCTFCLFSGADPGFLEGGFVCIEVWGSLR